MSKKGIKNDLLNTTRIKKNTHQATRTLLKTMGEDRLHVFNIYDSPMFDRFIIH